MTDDHVEKKGRQCVKAFDWRTRRLEGWRRAQPSNLQSFHPANAHIEFTLEIGVYAHPYVNASETFGFSVGFFSTESLTDSDIQTERDAAE